MESNRIGGIMGNRESADLEWTERHGAAGGQRAPIRSRAHSHRAQRAGRRNQRRASLPRQDIRARDVVRMFMGDQDAYKWRTKRSVARDQPL
jgi:hypothetical protein